jgi:hypothetical protein
MKPYRLPPEEGSAEQTHEGVRLTSRSGQRVLTQKYAFVTWGERHYLIPTNRLVDFCNAVNAGDEPRQEGPGQFLLRVKDWEKNVNGLPSVPADYKKYLLGKPLVAATVKVSTTLQEETIPGRGDKRRGMVVAVDKGTRHGLQNGMRLYTRENETFYAWAYVIRAEDDTAELLVISTGDEAVKVLKIGSTFSSKAMP